MPSALEMLSYVYFCSGCIVGPFFEFSDYKMYIERTGRYSNIPNGLWPALVKFLKGKACLASHIIVAQYCHHNVCGTEEYANHTFLYKVSLVF
jgi:lysophospholipid acyltransferase